MPHPRPREKRLQQLPSNLLKLRIRCYYLRRSTNQALQGGMKGEESGSKDDRQSFCKIGKAADALGVSRSILRRWADAGRIRAIRTPGGQRLFDPSSIEGYLVEEEKPSR